MPAIRPYRSEDWNAFVALDLQTGLGAMQHLPPEQQERFKARWPQELSTRFGWTAAGPTSNNSLLLVLEADGGAYAGHLWLSEQVDLFTGAPKLWVTTVAVAESHRGRGWGRLLMTRARDEARARGLSCVALGVDALNSRAQKLYEELGFVTTRLTMELSLHP